MAERENNIPNATRSRLPAYLRYLKGEADKGVVFISSASIAEDMKLSAISVRKDLAVVSAPGKPRMGFELTRLILDMERLLGYHRYANAIVVGAGRLGRAILCYEGFENYGIHVVAAFDNSPSKVGALLGKPIYPMERLKEIVAREAIQKAIITVPKEAAREVCDLLIDAGVHSILNFAPTYLTVPEGVQIKCVDFAAMLATLGAPLSK